MIGKTIQIEYGRKFLGMNDKRIIEERELHCDLCKNIGKIGWLAYQGFYITRGWSQIQISNIREQETLTFAPKQSIYICPNHIDNEIKKAIKQINSGEKKWWEVNKFYNKKFYEDIRNYVNINSDLFAGESEEKIKKLLTSSELNEIKIKMLEDKLTN